MPISSIIWIEGQGNYSLIHRIGEKPYLVSDTLKHFEQQLPAFMRVHKKALANPAYVDRLAYYGRHDAHLILTNGSRLPVARRRLKEVALHLKVDRLLKPSAWFSRMYSPQQGHFVMASEHRKAIIIREV